jgi:hypothetical protein
MRVTDITTQPTHQTYNKPESSNNMAQAIESRLLALVDELVLGIIVHIDSRDDLSNLAATCSRLQALAEPVLYRSILVRKGKQALLLYHAILIKPVRASFIRKLEIRYLYDYRKGINCLNQCLRLLCKLRELTIEAPCCNDTHAFLKGFTSKGEIDYADYFTFASSMLEAQPKVQVPLQTCKFNPGLGFESSISHELDNDCSLQLYSTATTRRELGEMPSTWEETQSFFSTQHFAISPYPALTSGRTSKSIYL